MFEDTQSGSANAALIKVGENWFTLLEHHNVCGHDEVLAVDHKAEHNNCRMSVREPDLVEIRVFGLSPFQNGNVRVRIFPERQEILVGGFRFGLIT